MSCSLEGACAPRNRRRVAPHLRWEELRWPSFTTWRWAGPALAGWIRYQWSTRRPPLPPRRQLHTSSKSHQPVPAPGLPSRDASRPGSRAAALPRSPLRGRAQRNRPKSPPRRAPGNPPRKAGGVRLARAPGKARAASLPAGRVRVDPLPGRVPRRGAVAGGGKPLS
jgi:hypothetical protein